jgi:hypothetical protein
MGDLDELPRTSLSEALAPKGIYTRLENIHCKLQNKSQPEAKDCSSSDNTGFTSSMLM